MQLISLGLLAFLIYIPLLTASAFYLAICRDGYLFSDGDISDLGQNVHGIKDEVFRVFIFLFGALNLLVVINLKSLLPKAWYAQLAYYLFFVASLFMASFSFFPENTQVMGHAIVGGGLFSATLLASLFFIPTVLSTSALPDYLAVINVFVIIFGILFCWAELIEIDVITSPPFYVENVHKRRGIWEWQTFFLSMTWVFLVTLLVFKNISGKG